MYRYLLWRELIPSNPLAPQWKSVVNFVMLNPSTADEEKNDPTIRKCCEYTEAWGYKKLVVTNLFAFRSPTPASLYDKPFDEVVGPENNSYIIEIAKLAGLVVYAWGNHGALHGRGKSIISRLRPLDVQPHYLKLNNSGEPSHPLYLPSTITPKLWT
jgi:hypothetical protein